MSITGDVHREGFLSVLAGIDEAGRGALAGPVVAGACILPFPLFNRRIPFPCWSPFQRRKKSDFLIADSKMLTPKERENSFEWIREYCTIGIGIVEADEIEKMGILKVTEKAMRLALEDLSRKKKPHSLLIDGRDKFSFSIPHRSIIRGDSLEPAIAAASIVAKVTRDRLMVMYGKLFPRYQFEVHKGYATTDHRTFILEHGPCRLHRQTFLQKLYSSSSSGLIPNQRQSKIPSRRIGSVRS